jgi:hypothetical protein
LAIRARILAATARLAAISSGDTSASLAQVRFFDRYNRPLRHDHSPRSGQRLADASAGHSRIIASP